MGGKCGGPSLRERAMNQQIHVQKMASLRQLKPPYDCPQCYSAKCVGVKEATKDGNRVFTFSCPRCNLKNSVTLNGKGYTSLDAYNKLIDQIYVKPTAT